MHHNILLASLPEQERALLLPDLKQVNMRQHDVLQNADEPVASVYFPLTCMISLLAVMEDGNLIEMAAIGREGAVGTSGGKRTPVALSRAVVQLGGLAMTMPLGKFQQAALNNAPISELIADANHVLTANLQQTAVCNALHPVEGRLARWLLHALDRHGDGVLDLTHEYLAEMLAVRRSTLTLTAKLLADRGLIRYRRGHIQVVDRPGLEATACECHRTLRDRLRRIGDRVCDERNDRQDPSLVIANRHGPARPVAGEDQREPRLDL
jgi:CRP-like cAMP-binding protein